MITVPGWVAAQLHIEEVYPDEEALRYDLSTFTGSETLPYVGVDDIVDALLSPSIQRVELLEIEGRAPWRFARLSIGGSTECVLVELDDTLDGKAPSAAIRTMLRAWLKDDAYRLDRLLADNGRKALIGWEREGAHDAVSARFCASLAGLAVPNVACSPALLARSMANIVVPSGALALKEARVYEGILQAAIQSASPPLRFLYLYRLFERAYLIDALEKLQVGFYDDPKRSIKIAEGTVSNEKASFLALVDSTSAELNFDEIAGLFDAAKASNSNRFMLALMKAASDEKELDYREGWKRGCILAYKMRCAIVHSGKAGPIFESFPDAAEACALVNGKLEAAAFALLGVTLS